MGLTCAVCHVAYISPCFRSFVMHVALLCLCSYVHVCACVHVCVRERQRQRQRDREREKAVSFSLCTGFYNLPTVLAKSGQSVERRVRT